MSEVNYRDKFCDRVDELLKLRHGGREKLNEEVSDRMVEISRFLGISGKDMLRRSIDEEYVITLYNELQKAGMAFTQAILTPASGAYALSKMIADERHAAAAYCIQMYCIARTVVMVLDEMSAVRSKNVAILRDVLVEVFGAPVEEILREADRERKKEKSKGTPAGTPSDDDGEEPDPIRRRA